MSQIWTSDSFAAGHVAQTDLQNMENNLLALQSSFSGAAQPAGAVAGMLWFNTAKKVLKTRDNSNAAWLGLFHGDVGQKILVYDNTVLEGYARDSGVTDKVIALKGGATYVTGGDTAGSWTISGLVGHNHFWYKNTAAGVADTDGAGTAINRGGTAKNYGAYVILPGLGGTPAPTNLKTDTVAVTHNGTDRIAAAVVILVYLDL